MHRHVLKVVSVWKYKICMKLETSLLETPKDTNDLVAGKELEFCHVYAP